jgi:hypothetical protein
MISLLSLCFILDIEVPIGAYNGPCDCKYNTYRSMLDSAVNCGLGYFKIGFIPRKNTASIDSIVRITSQYPFGRYWRPHWLL